MAAGPRRQHAVEHVDAARDRLRRCRPACRRPSGSAARSAGSAGVGRREHREHHRLRLADREAADRVAVEADGGERLPPTASAQVRHGRRPGRCRTAPSPPVAPKAAFERSAQRSDSRIARSISSARRRAARRIRRAACGCRNRAAPGSRASAPASARWAEPSMCERKVTPFSSSLRSAASDITWKPPESVRIGHGQLAKACRPPSAATRSAPGPQHQVIGVAEDDVGAERRAPGPGYIAFTVPAVPTGMKAGVRIVPRGSAISPVRAAPSVAIDGERRSPRSCCAPPGGAGRRRRRNRSGSRRRSRARRRRASSRGRRRPRPA